MTKISFDGPVIGANLPASFVDSVASSVAPQTSAGVSQKADEALGNAEEARAFLKSIINNIPRLEAAIVGYVNGERQNADGQHKGAESFFILLGPAQGWFEKKGLGFPANLPIYTCGQITNGSQAFFEMFNDAGLRD